MRGLLKIAPIIISATLLLCAAEVRTPLRPMYTADIAITSDGNLLLANKGTSEVTLLDKEGKRLHSWSTDEPPTGVVVVEGKAYVTSSYDRGHLTCIDLSDNSIKYSTRTGMGACAPTVSADQSKIYVLNRYKGTVSEVDATTGAVQREVKVLREPCDAVLSPDGRYLYVNNYLPAQRADVDYVAADVSIIDCGTFEKIKDVKLSNGSNALRGITISPDGKYVFVSHNLGRFQVPTSQLQQGWMNTNAVSVIDTSTQTLIGSMSIDEPDRGAGGIWDIACDGEYLVVSQSGTHEVSIISYKPMIEKLLAYPDREKMDYDLYFMRGIRQRLPIAGNGPRNMELKDGVLYLPTYFSDTLNVVTLADSRVSAIAYNPDRVESAADKGERAFNDAVLCFQNWQSCNGCHPGDGRTDGMNWDLMNDGIGNPKNCKSMLFSFETPKNMISGIRDHAGIAVRAGYKFIQFCDVEESVAQNVDEYIKSLKPLPSPYLVDGELSEKAVQGRKVYEKYGCAECHSGPYYTDMKMHRIGEDVEFDAGWDTPTLREVWRTAPYLFDGRAATMEEVFTIHKHGIEGKISRKDAEALAEYVNSL
ncbi:MAG: YVTN family beta-propeller repeat-containing protein [Rikenellaceae bacterium]|nr:YVTN family beta-propeller repeat-containing protein [Rikenellaceae bacterium]